MKWLQKKLRCHGLEIYMKIHVASKKRVASKKSQCHIGKTYMQRHFPPILDSAVAKTSSAMAQKHICKVTSVKSHFKNKNSHYENPAREIFMPNFHVSEFINEETLKISISKREFTSL